MKTLVLREDPALVSACFEGNGDGLRFWRPTHIGIVMTRLSNLGGAEARAKTNGTDI